MPDSKDAEFQKKLLAMFKVEAREHLDVISSGLAEMAKGGPAAQREHIETIYREAHSLKGAARSVNLADIVDVCQAMESVFSALKGGRLALSPPLGDLLQQAIDLCYRLVEGEEVAAAERSTERDLIRRLNRSVAEERPAERAGGTVEPEEPEEPKVLEEAAPPVVVASEAKPVETPPVAAEIPRQPAPPSVAPPSPTASETVRISTAKLDSLLIQAEEMVAVKLAINQRAAELKELKKMFDLWRKELQRKGSTDRSGSQQAEEATLPDPFISSFEARLAATVKAAEYDQRTSAVMVDKLLDDTKKTVMLPFSSLFEIFPRFVRDLARSAGKKLDLTTEGGEIEIDKRVLEEMKDPLIHLVRNSVDHGLETPEERQRKQKPPSGSIRISVSSRDGKMEITVADDGIGIDVLKMKASAVKSGLLSREAADKLEEKDARLLVFSSGVTTSPIITDMSGRGLGLAIVREKVEKLNGTITVESKPDTGTTFTIVIPLTLATFRGTLVKVLERLFVLPSVNIERVARVNHAEIQTVENCETLVFDGRPVSLVRLAAVLELPAATGRRQADEPLAQVVVLKAAEKRMAFLVDEVLSEQEVLVKPLGRQLSRVRNIAAATVLGSNTVVPILNVSDLLKSAIKMRPSVAAELAGEPEKSRSVLVVEDSITARTLLKNILESAGYEVKTSVDGIDGITALKSREFDIVVSDVEMPRMNGFELTAKIRADKKLAELPVVLVTALESREDRERGIDAGANAYIVKSSFDQSNLLEVIERLT